MTTYLLWNDVDIIDLKDALLADDGEQPKVTCKADIYEEGPRVYMIRLDNKEKVVLTDNKVINPVERTNNSIVVDLSGIKQKVQAAAG